MILNIFAFLGGIGFQELLLLFITFFVFVGPVVLIVFLLARRKRKVAPISVTGGMPKPALEYTDKLKELKSLLDQDIISKEEFEREKSKILG